MAWAIAVFGALSLWLMTTVSDAHQATPGVLALKEIAAGRFLVQWTQPFPPIDDLKIRFPAGCRHVDDPSEVLDCGAAGLSGTIEFESREATLARVSVNIEWLGGKQSFLLSSGSPPSVTLRAAREPSAFRVLGEYLELGVEHILRGIDHLLFLVGLMLLVHGWRPLLLTVSAFTAAHSITLAAASLNLVTLPTAPVEICIALSVLLLALEAKRGPQASTRRWPWAVAFAFGLLHGLGFASALAEVAFPERAVAVALVGFNLGVECGQVAVVSALALGYRLLKRQPQLRTRLAWAATWGLGVCSVYWLLQRTEYWLKSIGLLS